MVLSKSEMLSYFFNAPKENVIERNLNHTKVQYFYIKTDLIMKEIGKIFADNTNLEGNFIIDNPNNPKKRRIYLCLSK